MELIWIVVAILIASAAVFVTAYLLVKRFLDHEKASRLLEIRMMNQKQLTPIRLQAYERLTLFLERITPSNLVLRVYQPGMSSFQLQQALISAVREEFGHNLSQQIYISNTAWDLVRNCKEETIKLINIAASKLNDQATGSDLSTTILEISIQANIQAWKKAMDFIKEEIRQLF
jgi:hypothetical protein